MGSPPGGGGVGIPACTKGAFILEQKRFLFVFASVLRVYITAISQQSKFRSALFTGPK